VNLGVKLEADRIVAGRVQKVIHGNAKDQRDDTTSPKVEAAFACHEVVRRQTQRSKNLLGDMGSYFPDFVSVRHLDFAILADRESLKNGL
jgi:hypothetical protein